MDAKINTKFTLFFLSHSLDATKREFLGDEAYFKQSATQWLALGPLIDELHTTCETLTRMQKAMAA